MSDDTVKPFLFPVVRLGCYGKSADFGEYRKETGELVILNEAMIDGLDLARLKRELDERNQKDDLHGAHMLFGVPKKIWQEIQELEREAEDYANSTETRRINRVKATLLRNGFRLQQVPDDVRLLVIVHLASGEPVYWLSQNELRQAIPENWLEVARQGAGHRGLQ